MKSREEIDIMKRRWHDDPFWDLPDTEGFEDHKEELQGFQNMWHRIWKRENKHRQEVIEYCEDNLGDCPPVDSLLFNIIDRLYTLEKMIE